MGLVHPEEDVYVCAKLYSNSTNCERGKVRASSKSLGLIL